jgi:hypothetical protein
MQDIGDMDGQDQALTLEAGICVPEAVRSLAPPGRLVPQLVYLPIIQDPGFWN